MPSSFTPLLGLEKPADGEQDQIWGDTVNANQDKIDAGMGWYFVSSQNFTTPQSGIVFALPSRFQFYKLMWRDLAPTAAAPLVVRYSVDGGATALTSGYSSQGFTTSGTVLAAAGGNGETWVTISPATTTGGTFGSFEFSSLGFKPGRSFCSGQINTGGMFTTEIASMCADTNTATHVRLDFSAASFQAGMLRLIGASAI